MQSPNADTSTEESYEILSSRQESLLDERFPSRVVTVGQGDRAAGVVVREIGTGPRAVVMLHGIGSGSATWLESALALSEALPELRILAWDAPGYAESTPLPMARPLGSDYAARLGELLASLGIESAVLVGHSLGAFTACATARLLGNRIVKRVVLVSPAGGYGAPGQEEASAKTYAQRIGNLDSVGIAGMAEVVGKPGARMCAPDASPKARAWVRWNMSRLVDGGYRQAVEMLCGDSLLRYAPLDKQPAMPVEVHVGDKDIVTPPDACAAVADAYGASFALIPGPGHASPIERPAEVAAFIANAARSALFTSNQPR